MLLFKNYLNVYLTIEKLYICYGQNACLVLTRSENITNVFKFQRTFFTDSLF